MPTNKIQTGLRINEKTYIKIRYLCAKEQRSLNNLIEHVLQQYVDQWNAIEEREKAEKEAVPEAMNVLKSALEKAGVTDKDEIDKIYDLLKKSAGKQQFYREMLKIYGLERGVEVYKTVRPEYTNLTKLVRK